MHVYVCALFTIEAETEAGIVGQGRKRGHANADEAAGDFGGAPEEDFWLVVGDVGAAARCDTDGETDSAEGGGAGGVLLGWIET